jgi:hypothetical protein
MAYIAPMLSSTQHIKITGSATAKACTFCSVQPRTSSRFPLWLLPQIHSPSLRVSPEPPLFLPRPPPHISSTLWMKRSPLTARTADGRREPPQPTADESGRSGWLTGTLDLHGSPPHASDGLHELLACLGSIIARLFSPCRLRGEARCGWYTHLPVALCLSAG